MKTEQLRFRDGQFSSAPTLTQADLVLTFGETEEFRSIEFFEKLKSAYPVALIVGCSSSGNIQECHISHDDSVITAIKLDKSSVKLAKCEISDASSTKLMAEKLTEELIGEGLKHILIISEGLNINGSELADGFNAKVGNITTSGGLAGDGTAFSKTAVIANAPASPNIVAAIGIYGDAVVKTGSFAGFDEFGIDKIVTKSEANVVYEIDKEPALDMYKRYLGEEAEGLPLSGLYFPVSVKDTKESIGLIRTLLAIDNETKSLTFAGTIKQGSILRLMKSNIDNLIDSAGHAAKNASHDDDSVTGVCIAVSCVGRMIIMKQLVEEELDEVSSKLGKNVVVTGFYSYGELAPHVGLKECSLHNQTMTVTTIYE